MEHAVRTSGLTKHFGRRVALQDLDLEVPVGSVFGYLGPNGAGKTTTIKLLAGLYRATAGRAIVLGADALQVYHLAGGVLAGHHGGAQRGEHVLVQPADIWRRPHGYILS